MFSSPSKILFKLYFLLFVWIGGCFVYAENMAPAEPILNFKLPMFGENGFKIWSVSGEKGFYLDSDLIRIESMHLDVFSGAEDLLVTSQIKSSEAYVIVGQKVVKGDKDICISGDNFDITGEAWVWESSKKKVTVNQNVKVVFKGRIDNVF